MVRVWEVRPAGEGLARAAEAEGYEAQADRVLAHWRSCVWRSSGACHAQRAVCHRPPQREAAGVENRSLGACCVGFQLHHASFC